MTDMHPHNTQVSGQDAILVPNIERLQVWFAYTAELACIRVTYNSTSKCHNQSCLKFSQLNET